MFGSIEDAKRVLGSKSPAEAARMLNGFGAISKELGALVREIVQIPATDSAVRQFIDAKRRDPKHKAFVSLLDWLAEPTRLAWSTQVVAELKKLRGVATGGTKSGF